MGISRHNAICLAFFKTDKSIKYNFLIFKDMIIFSGDEMKIIELPAGYVTGSSLMPNKVNPDFLEIFQENVHKEKIYICMYLLIP